MQFFYQILIPRFSENCLLQLCPQIAKIGSEPIKGSGGNGGEGKGRVGGRARVGMAIGAEGGMWVGKGGPDGKGKGSCRVIGGRVGAYNYSDAWFHGSFHSSNILQFNFHKSLSNCDWDQHWCTWFFFMWHWLQFCQIQIANYTDAT